MACRPILSNGLAAIASPHRGRFDLPLCGTVFYRNAVSMLLLDLSSVVLYGLGRPPLRVGRVYNR